MSFSADWLALRESADMLARAASLLGKLRLAFADRDEITVADLGCGTGSTVRAVAAMLPNRQTWRLYDYDAALLAAARARLSAWAQNAADDGAALVLTWYGKTLRVHFERINLVSDMYVVTDAAPDLITASALFDLVSPQWIDLFSQTVATRRTAVYAALTYDGREEWTPPHEADAAMLAAFHAHQKTDKGFGVSAGPDAAGYLSRAFSALGYTLEKADSPWRIAAEQSALIEALTQGATQAATETGLVDAAIIAGWLAHRRNASGCVVGHQDILALPA
ncbi:MAG: SAM-dependent methyltransferase [Hyphomicrobiales bacterium]|nr:SAM-dependent methyltransferase [Hyphomicrobiales bacterium]